MEQKKHTVKTLGISIVLGGLYLLTLNIVFISIFMLIPILELVRSLYNQSTKWYKSALKITILVLNTLLIVFCFRLFFFDIFKIPSSSMEQTLLVGDYVLVKKDWKSEVAPNSPILPNCNTKLYKQNDIIVFLYPKNPKLHFVKRCIGLSGDSLQIIANEVYTNGQKVTKSDHMKWLYKLHYPDTSKVEAILFGHINRKPNKQFDKWSKKFRFHLTEKEAFAIDRLHPEYKIEKCNWIPKNDIYKAYPFSPLLPSTRDNVAPFRVPNTGHTIPINSINLAWYADIIKRENVDVVISDNTLRIDTNEVNTYTFKDNYYFMMGDNRHASQDSRTWGFVPEKHITGKVIGVIRNWDWLAME